MDLFENIRWFKPHEIKLYPHGGEAAMRPTLLFADELREHWGSPLIVTSSYRMHSEVKNSQHFYGRALDLMPVSGDARDLYDLACKLAPELVEEGWYTGIGSYPKFIHIDVTHPRQFSGRRRHTRWQE